MNEKRFKIRESPSWVLEDVVEFGKYSGRFIGWIVTYDLGYLRWMCAVDQYCAARYCNEIKDMEETLNSQWWKEQQQRMACESWKKRLSEKRGNNLVDRISAFVNSRGGIEYRPPNDCFDSIDRDLYMDLYEDAFAGNPVDFG